MDLADSNDNLLLDLCLTSPVSYWLSKQEISQPLRSLWNYENTHFYLFSRLRQI